MENKRGGQRSDIYCSQEGSRRRSFNKRPPRGSWQPTVPSWEKTFCKAVGSLDWEKLVDMKKFVHLYDNVVKWDDSAGEEAFHNAKRRFLAKMHGSPSNIELPDPDLYIDEVDWDSKVDPELLSDLECRYLVPDVAENNEQVVIFGDSLLRNQGFSSNGWGECEEDLKNAPDSSVNNLNNPRERSLCESRGSIKENGWVDFCSNGCVVVDNNASATNVDGGAATEATGWTDKWDDSWSWNHTGNQRIETKNPKGLDHFGAWDSRNGKKNNASRLMSRYRTSRFHSNEQHGSYPWRNGNGRKGPAFVPESSSAECWNRTNYCGPVSYHASGNGRSTWNLEKPVS